jgi:hypothetical protein
MRRAGLFLQNCSVFGRFGRIDMMLQATHDLRRRIAQVSIRRIGLVYPSKRQVRFAIWVVLIRCTCLSVSSFIVRFLSFSPHVVDQFVLVNIPDVGADDIENFDDGPCLLGGPSGWQSEFPIGFIGKSLFMFTVTCQSYLSSGAA